MSSYSSSYSRVYGDNRQCWKTVDNANRSLAWLPLLFSLPPSNHHRAAYLHLTRFRNTQHRNTHFHGKVNWNAYRVFTHTNSDFNLFYCWWTWNFRPLFLLRAWKEDTNKHTHRLAIICTVVVNMRRTKVEGGVKTFRKYQVEKKSEVLSSDCVEQQLEWLFSHGAEKDFMFSEKEDHLHSTKTLTRPIEEYPPLGNDSAECMLTYLCTNEWEKFLNTTRQLI